MEYELSNEELHIVVSSHGAELMSLRGKNPDHEYLFDGDPRYWARRAPHLFPVVGAFRHKEYRYQGVTYTMGQHGFARDSEFAMTGRGDNFMLFTLTETPQTLQNYPFRFVFEVEYRLQGRTLTVNWTVRNPANRELYFSVGGHPAFLCPTTLDNGYAVALYKNGQPLSSLEVHYLNAEGVGSAVEPIALVDGKLYTSPDLFARDALIIEGAQADAAALVDPKGREYIRVSFATPVLGIWSPVGKNAPFVCIEPWYGRADGDDFTGTLEERRYGNVLNQGGTFTGGFNVEIPGQA